MARELRAEIDTHGVSQAHLARKLMLTTARSSQLLGLLTLPVEILDYLEGLSGADFGVRFLTEHRVRGWVRLKDPVRQVEEFRKWRDGQT